SRPPHATSGAVAARYGCRWSAGGTDRRDGWRADRGTWCAIWLRRVRLPAVSRRAPGRRAPWSTARGRRSQILAHRPGPILQQLNGLRGLDLAGVSVVGRQRQRLDAPQRLTRDAERFPARRENPQPLTLPEHPVGERRRRLDDVLTVVGNQERFALADRG